MKPQSEYTIALAGNPNVGKSTVFNALTGMHQHTGNWPGKTVSCAWGQFQNEGLSLFLADTPGTYSLLSHSPEEEAARNFICFGQPDAVVVVCDAICLEHNLNLVLQILELTPHVIVCINMMDEASRQKLHIDIDGLSKALSVPVVGVSARKKGSLSSLTACLNDEFLNSRNPGCCRILYPEPIEQALSLLLPPLKQLTLNGLSCRWLGLRLLEKDIPLLSEAEAFLGICFNDCPDLTLALHQAEELLRQQNIGPQQITDLVVSSLVHHAEALCGQNVHHKDRCYCIRDRKLDLLFTNKWLGFPFMLFLLALVFWLTITGANYPSRLLSGLFFRGQETITSLFQFFHAPEWLHGLIVLGAYRVLAWVVAVMLPPMAIFFPLFTLLEDSGYLPRVAYNLDRPFKRCCACGKQALTLCMGFRYLQVFYLYVQCPCLLEQKSPGFPRSL